MTTVAQARRRGRDLLSNVDTAQLDADVLLGYVLGRGRERLLSHGDDAISVDQESSYEASLVRRSQGEPVAYITGVKSWFGLELAVSPAVLTPRPETESLVEVVLAYARERRVSTLVDVGTGSGAIAIALAMALPFAQVTATDISADALSVARANLARFGLMERVDLRHGNLLEPVADEPDVVVANLPYLPDGDRATIQREVRREPSTALFAGSEGLDLIDQVLLAAKDRDWNCPIFLEIDSRHAESVGRNVSGLWPARRWTLKKDLAGRDRVIFLEAVANAPIAPR